MTTRYSALTVVLDHDIREDDIEPLVRAISMLRGVQSVHCVEVDNSAGFAIEMRLRREVGDQLTQLARTVMKLT